MVARHRRPVDVVRRERPSVEVEDRHGIGQGARRIRDARPDGNVAPRSTDLRQCRAAVLGRAEARGARAVGRRPEFLDAIVAGVDDVDVDAVDRRGTRTHELPVARTGSAPLCGVKVGVVELLHTIVAGVDAEEFEPGRSDADGSLELPIAVTLRAPQVQQGAAIVEALDAAVRGVRHEDRPAAAVGRDTNGAAEVTRSVAGGSPQQQEVAEAVELLHAVETVVGHEHIADAVGRSAAGPLELACGGTLRAPLQQECPRQREFLDAIVAGVDDIEIATIDRDTVGSAKLPRGAARGAEAVLEHAGAIEDLHAIVAHVGDVHEPVVVDRDARGFVELPRAAAR